MLLNYRRLSVGTSDCFLIQPIQTAAISTSYMVKGNEAKMTKTHLQNFRSERNLSQKTEICHLQRIRFLFLFV